MTIRITHGVRVEINSPGWGTTTLFAETLEALDAEFEAYLTRLKEAKESRARQLLAQIAGKHRKSYKAAREALGE